MNNKTVETAKEALLRYSKVLEKIINDNPEDREEIEENHALVMLDEWVMSDKEIKEEEKRLDISFPLDILKFKKEVGNFQIGTQEEDEYGNDNYPVLSFQPLLKWWEKHTDLEEEFDRVEEKNKFLREKLKHYIIFFSEVQCIDSPHYYLDKSSQNLENNNMSIAEFHQDSWYYIATNKVEICKEVNIFDEFISKFIDDKIDIII